MSKNRKKEKNEKREAKEIGNHVLYCVYTHVIGGNEYG